MNCCMNSQRDNDRPAAVAPFGAILFDAVGTLLRPEPTVGVTYHAAGLRHGSQRSMAEIAERFQRAFAQSEAQDEARGDGRTDEDHEVARWRTIVSEVYDDVASLPPLLDELWRHFAVAEHWRLFEDAAAAWSKLAACGVRVGIASNFDSRLRSICQGLPPLVDCATLFISSEVGYRKPHVGFFRAIERSLAMPAERLLLVGDTPENDYHAAHAAGWQALLIDRHDRHPGVPREHKLRSLVELASHLDVVTRNHDLP